MQRRIARKRAQCIQLCVHLIIILIIAIVAITIANEEDVDVSHVTLATTVHAKYPERPEEKEEDVKETSSTEVQERTEDVEVTPTYPTFAWSKDWDEEDSYLLAKIAMAEAEGESLHTKTLVILTVLNRVHSDEFPDTIKEVIFQEYKGVYQFSPVMPGGRWWRVEPNEECYEAVEFVLTATYDYSEGALYFESCKDEDNWHSRNLEFLYESDGMRFYK